MSNTILKILIITVVIGSAINLVAQESGIYVPPHDIRRGSGPQGEELNVVAIPKPKEGERF